MFVASDDARAHARGTEWNYRSLYPGPGHTPYGNVHGDDTRGWKRKGRDPGECLLD